MAIHQHKCRECCMTFEVLTTIADQSCPRCGRSNSERLFTPTKLRGGVYTKVQDDLEKQMDYDHLVSSQRDIDNSKWGEFEFKPSKDGSPNPTIPKHIY